LLEVRNIDVSYGSTQVLWEVSMTVADGEIISLMGPNGSGKSTVFKAIIGLVKTTAGTITKDREDLAKVPTHEMAGLGIGLVLERRRLFPAMTVKENLLLGAFHRAARSQIAETLEWVESLFPILCERRHQAAGRLSGGEQQMVAIARGLMSRPKLLMMDEPFLGLAPLIVDLIAGIIEQINASGILVLFNEQNVQLSLSISHRGYLLESGRIVLEGTGVEMLNHDMIKQVYLGR
jgi:branched-chain amino acid transport system ATP-binding protein